MGPGSLWMGGKDYAGNADRYFAASFLPENGVAAGSIETRYWKVTRTVQKDGKEEPEPVSEGGGGNPLHPGPWRCAFTSGRKTTTT